MPGKRSPPKRLPPKPPVRRATGTRIATSQEPVGTSNANWNYALVAIVIVLTLLLLIGLILFLTLAGSYVASRNFKTDQKESVSQTEPVGRGAEGQSTGGGDSSGEEGSGGSEGGSSEGGGSEGGGSEGGSSEGGSSEGGGSEGGGSEGGSNQNGDRLRDPIEDDPPLGSSEGDRLNCTFFKLDAKALRIVYLVDLGTLNENGFAKAKSELNLSLIHI